MDEAGGTRLLNDPFVHRSFVEVLALVSLHTTAQQRRRYDSLR